MPIYVRGGLGQGDAGLDKVEPSFGLSLSTAFGSTADENPTNLILDAGRLRQANALGKPRLDKAAAEAKVKASGFKIPVPDDSYTEEALDILIQRRRDQAAVRLIQDRTPWSWIGSPIRGGASLLAGVIDPLNIASAFVPVVREQRAASMLARAGESAGARAVARAQIGAIEGAAGAAMLEPFVIGMHSQLQDDYGMTDSLVNLGFGTILGGGLHVGAGLVGDVWRPRRLTVDPASVPDLPDVIRTIDVAPATSARALLRGTSPEVRELALRSAIADMAQGKAPDVEAVLRADQPKTTTVYHGSPHKFDNFDSSKIGSGEGAQAYGYGLYLAESPLVAQTYKATAPYIGRHVQQLALDALRESGGDIAKARGLLSQKYSTNTDPYLHQPLADAANNIEDIAAGAVEGNLYKAEIQDEVIARMLDWDKPLSQQSSEVQKAIIAISPKNRTGQPMIGLDSTGEEIARVLGLGDGGSNLLRQQGIPGIRYLDGGSRGAGTGTSNYVLFPGEEGVLNITERNGERLQAIKEAAERQKTAPSAVAEPEASLSAEERLKASPKANGVEEARAEMDAALDRLGILPEEAKAKDPAAESTKAAQEAAKAQKASGVSLDLWLDTNDLPPEVHNLVIGLSEAATPEEQAQLLADYARSWAANPTKAADDIAADVVEAARSGRVLTPDRADVKEAKTEMFAAEARLAKAQSRMEAMGVTPADAAKIADGMKAFDDAITDAKNIGAAVKAFANCGTMT